MHTRTHTVLIKTRENAFRRKSLKTLHNFMLKDLGDELKPSAGSPT